MNADTTANTIKTAFTFSPDTLNALADSTKDHYGAIALAAKDAAAAGLARRAFAEELRKVCLIPCATDILGAALESAKAGATVEAMVAAMDKAAADKAEQSRMARAEAKTRREAAKQAQQAANVEQALAALQSKQEEETLTPRQRAEKALADAEAAYEELEKAMRDAEANVKAAREALAIVAEAESVEQAKQAVAEEVSHQTAPTAEDYENGIEERRKERRALREARNLNRESAKLATA